MTRYFADFVRQAEARRLSYKAPVLGYTVVRARSLPYLRGSLVTSPCVPVYADTRVSQSLGLVVVRCKTTVRLHNAGLLDRGVYARYT